MLLFKLWWHHTFGWCACTYQPRLCQRKCYWCSYCILTGFVPFLYNEEHLMNLSEVLQRLQNHGERLKLEKCCFMEDSVEYFGHRVDSKGLHTTDSKLKTIFDAPPPRNAQELQAFLGLLNYYGQFIPNWASLTQPLNSLLCKDSHWKWTKAFQHIKDVLVSFTFVTHYNPCLPLRLPADASAYRLGAVISHAMVDGKEHRIAFASRTLSKSEQNYYQIEKEALALIFCVKKFHLYLCGWTFTLVTDHKPLTIIFGAKRGAPSLGAAHLQFGHWSCQHTTTT